MFGSLPKRRHHWWCLPSPAPAQRTPLAPRAPNRPSTHSPSPPSCRCPRRLSRLNRPSSLSSSSSSLSRNGSILPCCTNRRQAASFPTRIALYKSRRARDPTSLQENLATVRAASSSCSRSSSRSRSVLDFVLKS